MRDALARIEEAARENIEDGWQDDYPLDDDSGTKTSSRDLLQPAGGQVPASPRWLGLVP